MVEDEVLIAVALEEALEELGIAVVGPFPSLRLAVEALHNNDVDVAVLDVNVRGEMVFPLASQLQAQGVPIVFCTGYADLKLIPAGLNAFPCIGKPCSGETLEAALARALSMPPEPVPPGS